MTLERLPTRRVMGTILPDSPLADKACAAIIGVPYTGGNSHYYGSRRHPTEEIRTGCINPVNRCYSPFTGEGNHGAVVIDHGDILWHDDWSMGTNAMAARLPSQLKPLFTTHPIILGGDHSIGFPIAQAARELLGEPVFHLVIDAHSDMWPREHDALNHGTWLADAIEYGYSAGAFVFGAHARANERRGTYTDRNVTLIDPEDAVRRAYDLEAINGWPHNTPCWLSIDLDGVDPAFAPGVATPEPGGLMSREALRLISVLMGNYNVVGADIVEYCPAGDVGGITAALAGSMIHELVNGFLTYQGSDNQWKR